VDKVKENIMAEEQTPAEGQVEETAPAEGQAEVTPPSQPAVTAEDFLADTKFKDFDAAGKSMKEAQATITRQAQEKKELEETLQGMSNAQSQRPPVQGQAPKDFFDDPEGNVSRQVTAQVSQALRHQKASSDIENIRDENPEKFAKLEPFMKQVYQNKPYLETMGKKGLRLAMGEAETNRKTYVKSLKDELLGDEADGDNLSPEDKMRAEILADIEKKQGATIPSGSVRGVSSDSSKKVADAVAKGDVDGVLDNLL
jgi:hypothetical protein